MNWTNFPSVRFLRRPFKYFKNSVFPFDHQTSCDYLTNGIKRSMFSKCSLGSFFLKLANCFSKISTPSASPTFFRLSSFQFYQKITFTNFWKIKLTKPLINFPEFWRITDKISPANILIELICRPLSRFNKYIKKFPLEPT